jgi:hypothetical protein
VSLKETGSLGEKGGCQSIEPVSAGADVAAEHGIGLSARFPFMIACKEMTLVFRSWLLSRPIILAELRLLEVVLVAAGLLSVD